MKKIKMLLILSVIFTLTFVAFVGCGGISPTTGHNGRIAGGFTVLDFDVNFRSHAEFTQVEREWDNAIVYGNTLETNRNRAKLAFRPTAMFGISVASDALRVPTEARAFVNLCDLYGETLWSSPNVTGSSHEIAVGEGFYIQQLVNHPASAIEGTSATYQRHFTAANLIEWFGLTYPGGGTPPANWGTLNATNLVASMHGRWNADGAGAVGSPELLQARAANRASMIAIMNERVLHADMKALGYEFINVTSNSDASTPFSVFIRVDATVGAENPTWVFVHGAFSTFHPVHLSRHMRFTATDIRTYQNEGRIDESSTERTEHYSLNAEGTARTNSPFVVFQGNYSPEGFTHRLRPIISETIRRAVTMNTVLETTKTSTYHNGQVRSITFQIRGQNNDGASLPLTETTSMTFLIDRLHD